MRMTTERTEITGKTEMTEITEITEITGKWGAGDEKMDGMRGTDGKWDWG